VPPVQTSKVCQISPNVCEESGDPESYGAYNEELYLQDHDCLASLLACDMRSADFNSGGRLVDFN
jgi:hypothetical protein